MTAKLEAAGEDWFDQLPWVMLSIRTTPKEDMENATLAEMVYGETVRLPGEFFNDRSHENEKQALQFLRDKVDKLKPIPTSRHGGTKHQVPGQLMDAKMVFVRHDAV